MDNYPGLCYNVRVGSDIDPNDFWNGYVET